jgi:FkbM family methyltransferase
LCFDIGANLGDRTEVFIALGATAVAVEPQDYCLQRLRKKFRKSQRVIVVPKAVGDKDGEAEMMLSNFHPLSSLSSEWVNSVKAGHRLGGFSWDKKVIVPVTTMKRLIEEYGRPGFCKIDVEGFESQVLSTLSEPIDIVSFEYNPEFTDAAIRCVNHLSAIGMNHFNYSIGESMCFALENWNTPGGMCAILKSLPDNMVHGDVYAMSEDGYSRYISPRSAPAQLLANC